MTVSGELLTPQDTLQVFGVVIFLMAFVWLIKIILNTMGIKI
jgi:preprotein translocase subunit SecE